MQFPIEIGLRRSFFLGTALCLATSLALGAVWLPDWPPVLRSVLSAAIMAMAWHALRQSVPPVAGLLLQHNSRLAVRLRPEEGFIDVVLLGPAFVHRALTVVRCRDPQTERRYSLVILPDSLSVRHFRLLRVWLRAFAGTRKNLTVDGP